MEKKCSCQSNWLLNSFLGNNDKIEGLNLIVTVVDFKEIQYTCTIHCASNTKTRLLTRLINISLGR